MNEDGLQIPPEVTNLYLRDEDGLKIPPGVTNLHAKHPHAKHHYNGVLDDKHPTNVQCVSKPANPNGKKLDSVNEHFGIDTALDSHGEKQNGHHEEHRRP